MKRVIVASAILWLASVACCSILEMGDSRREIVGGYCFFSGSSISLTGITLCEGGTIYHVISPQIIGSDWNDDFIVVKRDADDLTDLPEQIEWYIIDVQDQILYGPYKYDEYLDKRNELMVPSDLELLSP
ncbi:MAG TPA: hypothetical protein V6D48_12205 [Oculatellaceae cyanobacterium]